MFQAIKIKPKSVKVVKISSSAEKVIRDYNIPCYFRKYMRVTKKWKEKSRLGVRDEESQVGHPVFCVSSGITRHPSTNSCQVLRSIVYTINTGFLGLGNLVWKHAF